jgi:hypothetical protein
MRMPIHKHRLKGGVILMLLWNLNTIQGLFNGTRSVLRTLYSSVIDHKIIAEHFQRNGAFILRITFSALGQIYHTNSKENSFQSGCLLNDNKTQAQTFNKIDAKPLFMHRQPYAAFSTVRNFYCDELLQRIIMFIEIKFCYNMQS